MNNLSADIIEGLSMELKTCLVMNGSNWIVHSIMHCSRSIESTKIRMADGPIAILLSYTEISLFCINDGSHRQNRIERARLNCLIVHPVPCSCPLILA